MPTFKTIFYCLLILSLFTFIACQANKSIVNQPTQKTIDNSNTVDNSKIMVLLQTEIKANALEEEFKTYELKSKGLISRTENRCMFTYNQALVDSNTLLEMIKKSDKVLEAKFPEIARQPKVTN